MPAGLQMAAWLQTVTAARLQLAARLQMAARLQTITAARLMLAAWLQMSARRRPSRQQIADGSMTAEAAWLQAVTASKAQTAALPQSRAANCPGSKSADGNTAVDDSRRQTVIAEDSMTRN